MHDTDAWCECRIFRQVPTQYIEIAFAEFECVNMSSWRNFRREIQRGIAPTGAGVDNDIAGPRFNGLGAAVGVLFQQKDLHRGDVVRIQPDGLARDRNFIFFHENRARQPLMFESPAPFAGRITRDAFGARQKLRSNVRSAAVQAAEGTIEVEEGQRVLGLLVR